MLKNLSPVHIIVFVIATFLLLSNALYVVDQRQQALVFQFGEVVDVIQEPGLHGKVPFLQVVSYFDNQILNLEAEKKEVISKGKKKFIVSAFAKYKIVDPLKFYKSVGDVGRVRARLTPIFESSLREILGKFPLSALLSSERAEIMKKIEELFATQSQDFGIEIIDVRIVRTDLPKDNLNAIYKRMQADREKEAKEHRAEGAEEAQRIKSSAEKDREILLADATKQAEEIRGEGDAISSKIFADAYNQDTEFFNFYRSLKAYKQSFSKEDTKIVMSSDNDFLKYFTDISEK